MNQRKTSARYYLFEDLIWEMPGFARLKRPKSIERLQAIANRVWASEGGRGEPPAVLRRRAQEVSYYLAGAHRIRLVAKHQNLGGLLHELAHALGTRDKLTHGPAFRKRCLRLYKQYGGWSGAFDG
jgi:hypothetical protein